LQFFFDTSGPNRKRIGSKPLQRGVQIMAARSLYASKSIIEHLFRGVVGFGGVAGAIWFASASIPMATLGVIASSSVAFVAFRGCPICWTVGLVNTLLNTKLKAKSCPSCVDNSLQQS
jgi:hypothetical protein